MIIIQRCYIRNRVYWRFIQIIHNHICLGRRIKYLQYIHKRKRIINSLSQIRNNIVAYRYTVVWTDITAVLDSINIISQYTAHDNSNLTQSYRIVSPKYWVVLINITVIIKKSNFIVICTSGHHITEYGLVIAFLIIFSIHKTCQIFCKLTFRYNTVFLVRKRNYIQCHKLSGKKHISVTACQIRIRYVSWFHKQRYRVKYLSSLCSCCICPRHKASITHTVYKSKIF